MNVAKWDDSCVVFPLKGVQIRTESTRKYFPVFFIIAYFEWSEVKKRKK